VTYIEDDELRELFASSSQIHIQGIEASILALELQPTNQELISSLMRQLHALKGDAGALGVASIESLSHQMEDIAELALNNQLHFNKAIIDTFLEACDGLKMLATEAITGNPAAVSAFYLVGQLRSCAEPHQHPSHELLTTANVDNQFVASSIDENSVELNLPSFSVMATGDNDSNVDSQLTTPSIDGNSVELNLPPLSLLATSDDFSHTPESSQSLDLPATASDITEAQTLIIPRANEVDVFDSVRVSATRLDILTQCCAQMKLDQQQLTKKVIMLSELFSMWELLNAGHLELLPEMGQALKNLEQGLDIDSVRIGSELSILEETLHKLQALPSYTAFASFPRTVRDIAKKADKQVRFVLIGGETLIDRKILETIHNPILHLIRNAIDHGIESPQQRTALGKPSEGVITLSVASKGDIVEIKIADDGSGLDLNRIKQTAIDKGLISEADAQTISDSDLKNLIFKSGFSTKTEVSVLSGRGVGLDIVKRDIQNSQGQLYVDSIPQKGTTFTIRLKTRKNITSILVAKSDQQCYGFPADDLITTLLLNPKELLLIDNQTYYSWENHLVPIVFMNEFLDVPAHEMLPRVCLIYNYQNSLIGFLVDELIDFQQVQVKPQPKFLQGMTIFSGTSILSDGTTCYIIDLEIASTQRRKLDHAQHSQRLYVSETIQPIKILLVEDSSTIRTQLISIFTKNQYLVDVAVNGLEGYHKALQKQYECIISDIEMPIMNGWEMIEKIRNHDRNTPIIVLTTLQKESDKQRGLAIGANAYLSKVNFDQYELLQTIADITNNVKNLRNSAYAENTL